MKAKQTKIVATISDLKCDVKDIEILYNQGIDVVRLNTAHQTPESTLVAVKNIRKVSDKIGILIDTKGPEVRTTEIETPIEVEVGEEILVSNVPQEGKYFSVSYDSLVEDVPVGSKILIDDGETEFEVTGKKDNALICKATNSGVVKNKRSVNVPDIHLDLPSLTDKDRDYITFAIEHEIDFIAHSFVRNKQDVQDIQTILDEAKSDVKIIAKIENREGVKNIEEILDLAFGVMIARGDLGIEIPAAEVPVVQKQIIKICRNMAKPVITATQMLHSMIESPRPTRAEVSDVANAVFDGTDSVMLSGETAYGINPPQAVKMMADIIRTVEEARSGSRRTDPATKKPIRNYLTKSAVDACAELPIKAIIVDTATGISAQLVSAYRGKVPIYAFCYKQNIVRALSLSYGVNANYLPMPASTDMLVKQSLSTLVEDEKIHKDDLVVVLAGTPDHSDGANFIEITTARMYLKNKE